MLRVAGLPKPDYLRTVGLQKWTPGEGWSVDTLSDGPAAEHRAAARRDHGDGHRRPRTATGSCRSTRAPTSSPAWTRAGPSTRPWSRCTATRPSHRPRTRSPCRTSRPTADELRVDTVTPGGTAHRDRELAPEVVHPGRAGHREPATAFDKAQALTQLLHRPGQRVRLLAGRAGRRQRRPARRLPDATSRASASSTPRRWRSCCARWASRPGSPSASPRARRTRRQLRDHQQRRPRLGRGAVQRRRLGALRPDAARRRDRAGSRASPRRRAPTPPRPPPAAPRRPPGSARTTCRPVTTPTTSRRSMPAPPHDPGRRRDRARHRADRVVRVPRAARAGCAGRDAVDRSDRPPRRRRLAAGRRGRSRCGRGGVAGDRGPGGRPRIGPERGGVGAGDREPAGQGRAPGRARAATTCGPSWWPRSGSGTAPTSVRQLPAPGSDVRAGADIGVAGRSSTGASPSPTGTARRTPARRAGPHLGAGPPVRGPADKLTAGVLERPGARRLSAAAGPWRSRSTAPRRSPYRPHGAALRAAVVVAPLTQRHCATVAGLDAAVRWRR